MFPFFVGLILASEIEIPEHSQESNSLYQSMQAEQTTEKNGRSLICLRENCRNCCDSFGKCCGECCLGSLELCSSFGSGLLNCVCHEYMVKFYVWLCAMGTIIGIICGISYACSCMIPLHPEEGGGESGGESGSPDSLKFHPAIKYLLNISH